MSDAVPCPCCGRPHDPQAGAVDALYREVRRIRQVAEARQPDADKDRRIEELTLEVRRLQETVARLRGTSAIPPARPSRREVSLSHLS
ncbi:MAG: hypothetical protein GEV03_08055 [Streptosporangiales bacterium]|nr:hypothetical protein [Streptosporangiales bacterium]